MFPPSPVLKLPRIWRRESAPGERTRVRSCASKRRPPANGTRSDGKAAPSAFRVPIQWQRLATEWPPHHMHPESAASVLAFDEPWRAQLRGAQRAQTPTPTLTHTHAPTRAHARAHTRETAAPRTGRWQGRLPCRRSNTPETNNRRDRPGHRGGRAPRARRRRPCPPAAPRLQPIAMLDCVFFHHRRHRGGARFVLVGGYT